MVLSKFNTFFFYEDNYVGYNSYSNEFILVNPALYDLCVVGSKKNDYDELKEIHEEFYKFLVQKGFLVADSLDEFEMVKEQSRKIDSDSSVFELIVNPTMNCNFKCWYCYETHIKDSKMDADTIASVISFSKDAIKHQSEIKTFVLSFFGGEPLLYFDKVIKPILTEVSDFCKVQNVNFSSGMTTNGLLITPQMLNFCKKYGLSSFQITLDGNRDRHDKVRFISEGRGSYDRIVENVKLALKNAIRVNLRINYSIETICGLEDILMDFKDLSEREKNLLNFDFQKVWQEEASLKEEIRSIAIEFDRLGYQVSGLYGGFAPVLSSCYADKRYQATINYNGEVFKCTARDFTNNTGEGVLNADGTITWNEKYERRLHAKFNNAPCKECKILPICGGGCSQHALEHEGIDYCVYNFDEDAKTEMIRNKFEMLIAK